MKAFSILAVAAAAALAVPAATAAAAPAAPAISAPANAVAFQRHHRRAHWRTVCTTKWRHHHRVRVCRKVRVWR